MTDSIETAMRFSFRKWRKGPERPLEINGRVLRSQFMVSMARRLSDRLDEMTEARSGKQPQTSDSRSLVLIKNAVVEEQYAELGMKLNKTSATSYRANDQAAAAGRAAGDKHQFQSGVTARTNLRIGN